ncbi:MAG: MobA/MobL family protein [Candidatus Thiodiazotropha sp.]
MLKRLEVKAYGRKKGHSATAASAYRAGEQIRCDKHERIHDYRNRTDIQFSTFDPRFDSRQALWNKVERAEKNKNATVAREFLIALPNEWDQERQAEFSLEFVDMLADNHGFAWQLDIHGGKGENPHAHILVSTRRYDEDAGEFTEKTRELDGPRGGGKMTSYWREQYEDMVDDWHEPEFTPEQSQKYDQMLRI